MIYLAAAIIYCADLVLGCWLIGHDYPGAGAWVIVLTLLFGGISTTKNLAKGSDA